MTSTPVVSMPPMLFSVPSMLVIVPFRWTAVDLVAEQRIERRDAGIERVLRIRRLDRALDVDVVVVGLDQQALEAAAQRDLPGEAGRQGLGRLRLQVAVAAGVDRDLRIRLHVVAGTPSAAQLAGWTGLTAVLHGSVMPESKRAPRLNSSPMFGARNPSA